MRRARWCVAVLFGARSLAAQAVPAPEALPEMPPPEYPTTLPPAPIDRRWERWLALIGHVAPVGGPYGVVGASVEASPWRWLTVGGGGGFGFGGVLGTAMVRARVASKSTSALFLGSGMSVGRYDPFLSNLCMSDVPCAERVFDRAYWVNVEAGYEYRSLDGFTFRVSPGFSILTNPHSWRCEPGPPCSAGHRDLGLPYVELAVGRLFE